MPKARKLPSGRWRAKAFSHIDENGKYVYRSVTADTKSEAEYLAIQFAARRKLTRGMMTVGEAIDRYIASKSNVLSPSTIHGYKKIRKNNFQKLMDVNTEDITREMVQRAVNEEALIRSPKSVANAYSLVSAAVLMQVPDLVLRITLPRRVKPITKDLPTSDEVIAAVKGTPVELPVLLALCLCLRLSEARGIKKSAIQGNTLRIERVVVTVCTENIEKELAKTDATRRIVKLPPFIKQMILSQDSEYATTLTGRAIYARFTRLMNKAGHPHVRFHDLRHIAASDMNRLGITDRVAADRGGWSTTATMRNVYQHSFTQDRIEADDIIEKYYKSLYENPDVESDDDNK